MPNAQQLILLRNDCDKMLRIADEALDKGDSSKALTMYKTAVTRAEEIFRISNADIDRELVIKVYEHMAKYHRTMYNYSHLTSESHQAFAYYERIVVLYKELIANYEKEQYNLAVRNFLEDLLQVIKLSLELKNYNLYADYNKMAITYAKALNKANPVYESEQYLILLNIFRGDYYRFKKKYRFAYVYYYVAMKKLKKIYNNYPQDGIRNDLSAVYTSLYEMSLLLNYKRSKNKYKALALESKGDKRE